MASDDSTLHGPAAGDDDPDGTATSPDRSHEPPSAETEVPSPAQQPVSEGLTDRFPVVGIGASAGGLEAIEAFFENLPAAVEASFVVVQHLSPDFKSLMEELLSRRTELQVRVAVDGMRLQAGCVHLLPPRKNMIVAGGRLLLSDRDESNTLHLPIDIFFRSLAEEFGPRGVAIVLSGTGTDGSRGVAAVRSAGGRVLTQAPETARFDGMPRSAAAAAKPDQIASPPNLASYVVRLATPETLQPHGADDPAVDEPFDLLLELLRERYSVDFSFYKTGTVERRIQRRVAITQSESTAAYLQLVREDDHECEELYRSVLVSVTAFCRDEAAFDILREQVVPELIELGKRDGALRVWCAGCATGEEAYSLAILILDEIARQKIELGFKLFATDIDAAAIAIATAGRYGEGAMSGLRPEQVDRYFQKDAGGYTVTREVRDRVVFALHDLTRDPPFTRIHLVSCRNLLIYLQKPHQARLFNLLHFALRARGFLFLGPSEIPTAHLASEFLDVDRKWNIFRKKRSTRMLLPEQLRQFGRTVDGNTGIEDRRIRRQHSAEAELLENICSSLIPADSAAVLLGPGHRVERIFGDASRFLRVPEGQANADLLRMVSPAARTALTVAIAQARSDRGHDGRAFAVAFETGAGTELADITVRPLPALKHAEGAQLQLVLFEAQSANSADSLERDADGLDGSSARQRSTRSSSAGESHDATAARVRTLQFELEHTKENLHATVQELESSNEELQSTNEELLTSNEELQSTNEELHSVNEELFTVNAEHQVKIDELVELSSDIENLMHATEIGVIFLDAALCIRKFTPAITRAIALVEHDIGRPLSHLAHSIDGLDLEAAARHVLEQSGQLEREVESRDGGTFLLRILPYRASRDRVRGVVMTLVDVREIKSTQESLSRSEARFRELVENIDEAFWIRTADCRDLLYLSPQFERVFGYAPLEVLSDASLMLDFVAEEDRARFRSYLFDQLRAGKPSEVSFRILRGDGELRWIHSRGHPICDDAGRVRRVIGFSRDITEQRKQEDALRQLTQELEALANRDPLTGLLNRRGLASVLSREIDRAVRSGHWLVAVMIDLDDFKSINDQLGHSAGDVVLKDIAGRMKVGLRPNDILARIGGDEFLALLPDTRFAEALQVAERLRLAVSDSPIRQSGQSVQATASFGVARVSEATVAVEEILGQTRHALARGKSEGKNQVVIADSSGEVARTQDFASSVLEEVLDHRGIRAFSQTIRDLRNGDVVAHEVLSRGPQGTYEGPDALFRLAIERNVLSLVDLQCFKACVSASTALEGLRVHVNLYPSTLLDTPSSRLIATLEQAGGPERFCVELSEQQFLGDPAYLAKPVRALRDAGVRVAIDDVGFGRSSLESLIVLEPDLIKVDRSFVAGAAESAARTRNLTRLVRIAHHLAGELVAEGVENEATRDLLVDLGVRFAQGFLWDKPKPLNGPGA